jgi:thiol-disulfide isomerase/thioredoxin
MTTADTKPTQAGEQLIEQRLDALDRALLGILPRSERLAIVTQVETRVRELTDENTALESSAETAAESHVLADAVSRRTSGVGPKRRSRLALSSGILGITALAMLFAMPITYLFVMTIGEELGEMVSISLLSIHVLAVAVGGLVALIMGISGLVSLARRKGQMVGHGWAITGLCTAPLPTLIGGLMVLVTGLSLFAVQSISVQSGTPVNVVSSSSTYYPAPPATCGPSTGSFCAPASEMPASISLPLPVKAAPACAAPIYSAPVPTFCAPAAASPRSVSSEPTLPQEQINWQTDIDQALKQAKEEKKLVLVHFYGDSCPPCRAVEQKVFPQPQVVQAMMRNYVPVKINVDEDQKTATRYAVRQIPTDVLLGGDGKETYRAISKQLATEYATMLNSVAIQTGRTPSIGDGETTAIYDLAPTFPSAPSAGPPSAASVPGTAAGAPASVGPYSTAPTAPAPSNAVPQFADPPSLR